MKRKRYRRKAHNIILKSVTWIAGIGGCVSACMIDSPSWLFFMIWLVCAQWLAMFFVANRERIEKKVEGEFR